MPVTEQGRLAMALREKVDEHRSLWKQHSEAMSDFLTAVNDGCVTEAQIFSDSLDAITDEMRTALAQAQMAEMTLVRAMKKEKALMLDIMEGNGNTDLEGAV